MNASGKRRVLRDLNAVRRAFADGPQNVLDACDGIVGLLAELDRGAAPAVPKTKRNRKGETALHAACASSKRRIDTVRELLAAGADPNTKDNAGWTPLHELVCKGDTETATALLDAGAAPDVPGPNNDTPLHEALRGGFFELAELLVARGADPHARNSSGQIALDAADDETKRKLVSIASSRNPSRIEHDPPFVSSPTDELHAFVEHLGLDVSNRAKALANAHLNLTLDDRLTDACSFVLAKSVDAHEARLEYATLMAVALGVPVINATWLEQCTQTALHSFDEFKLSGLGGHRSCVRLSVGFRRRMFPRLFDGCHFYFVGLNKPYEFSSHLNVTKDALSRLVVAAGGVVLKREPDPEAIPPEQQKVPYYVDQTGALANCSHYIIYRLKPRLTYNMSHVKSLPVRWLIECLQNFMLVDPVGV